jgi:TonB family protein
MYFDFEDYHPDIETVGRAISWREGILLSIIVHLVTIILILLAPKWMPKWLQWKAPPPIVLQQPPRDQTRYVFVQPRIERPVFRAPDRAEPSDRDRVARAPEKAPNPTNPLPFSRGNTPERVDTPPAPVARGRGPQPDPAAGQMARNQQNEPPQPDSQVRAPEGPPILTIPSTKPASPQNSTNGAAGTAPVPGGLMGDAIKNLQRSMRDEGFQNLGGTGGQFGPEIQFDTKGVEFGPWLNRFIAQLRRNWYAILPYEAMLGTRGHVAITFNVHKTGALTDVTVVGPCPIDAFNNAAYGALMATNPTSPIPAAYPDERAFFTVTFFYNETPPRQ